MPARFVMSVGPGQVGDTPPDSGRLIHAAVLNTCRSWQEELGEHLHRGRHAGTALRHLPEQVANQYAGPQSSPLAVTPLILVGEPGEYRFEVGVLDDSLVSPVAQAFEAADELHIGPRLTVPVTRIDVFPCWYGTLGSTTADHWTIQLETATGLYTSGGPDDGPRRALPMPDIGELLTRLARRHDDFAPEPLPAAIGELVGRYLVITDFKIQSAVHTIKVSGRQRTRRRGAKGAIGLELLQPDRHTSVLRHGLDVLLDFANYAGLGHQTTKGMGYTVVSPSDAPQSTKRRKASNERNRATGLAAVRR